MKCPQCGSEVPFNRFVCDQCGTQVEHDESDMKGELDREAHRERAQATERSVRWFLATALVLVIVGWYFRRAYKELPHNDIVAFAAAPTVSAAGQLTVGTERFGVPLPEPKPPHKHQPPKDEDAIDQQLRDEAYQRAAVTIKKRGTRQRIEGLLVGDLVLYLPVPGQRSPVPVHIAEVRRIRPLGQGRWEITAGRLKSPVRVALPNASKIRIPIQVQRADGKASSQTVLLDQIQELKPL